MRGRGEAFIRGSSRWQRAAVAAGRWRGGRTWEGGGGGHSPRVGRAEHSGRHLRQQQPTAVDADLDTKAALPDVRAQARTFRGKCGLQRPCSSTNVSVVARWAGCLYNG